jgi:hypothetical protein
MTIEQQVAYYLDHLDRRVSRLETLEAAGGGGGGDLFLIETVNLTVQGNIQITNIPSTAKHLFYTGFVRGNGQNCAIIMNGAAHALDLTNLATYPCVSFAGQATFINNLVVLGGISFSAVGTPDDSFASLWGWIPDIQDTSNKTGACGWTGAFLRDDVIQHNLADYRGGGNWDSAAAITQIDLFHSGAGGALFEAGSRFTLYGLTA